MNDEFHGGKMNKGLSMELWSGLKDYLWWALIWSPALNG